MHHPPDYCLFRVADVAAHYRRLGLYRVLLSVVLGSIAAYGADLTSQSL